MRLNLESLQRPHIPVVETDEYTLVLLHGYSALKNALDLHFRLPIPWPHISVNSGERIRPVATGFRETFSLAPTPRPYRLRRRHARECRNGCDRLNTGMSATTSSPCGIVSNRSGGVNNLTGTVAQGKAPIAAFFRVSSPAIR